MNNSRSNERINIDRIVTITAENGRLVRKDFAISQPSVLDTLRYYRDCAGDNLMNMQSAFQNYLFSCSNFDHKICLPYNYRETFVDVPRKPEAIDGFHHSMRNASAVKSIRYSIKEYLRNKKELSDFERDNMYESLCQQRIESYYTSQKKDYFEKCERYIYADSYNKRQKDVIALDNVKMYSHESMGWTDMEYHISEDFTVVVKTNFCYGNSAHFRVVFRYKGIDILPYSFLTTYYYAGMLEITHATMSLHPERQMWLQALNFVAEAGNLAASDPQAFIKKYIIDEADKMIAGLEDILNNTDRCIERFIHDRNKCGLPNYYVSIRNASQEEAEYYNACPEEVALSFRAEKITGALCFVENLRALECYGIDVNRYITEICRYNRSIAPELKDMIGKVSVDVKKLREELTKEENILKPIRLKYDYYWDKFERNYANKLTCYSIDTVVEKYPAFKPVLEAYNKQIKVVNAARLLYEKREKYLSRLLVCQERLDKYILNTDEQ